MECDKFACSLCSENRLVMVLLDKKLALPRVPPAPWCLGVREWRFAGAGG
ncbi:MAG: hypothetical protein MZV49_19890 [Rhodopseudomonas palustris]|nr:hypothetical protein [Rhodopseudomonas palustris]